MDLNELVAFNVSFPKERATFSFLQSHGHRLGDNGRAFFHTFMFDRGRSNSPVKSDKIHLYFSY